MKHRFSTTVKMILACVLALALFCACTVTINLGGADTSAAPNSESKLIVHFLDVGQGDSIFIELPNGKTMLVDAGENYHGQGIIDYVQTIGYHKLDYVVATHPHEDHIGSMPYIVRNFEIGSIYMPDVTANTATFESLLKAIKAKGLRVKNGRTGVHIIKDGELTADIIAPDKPDESNLNNSSIVLLLTFGNVSYLLTGDAETKELNAIRADMHATVLKAGHHGSKTSTTQTLLKKISPSVTVISCGKNNDYGHPHAEVLKMLKSVNSSVYRTDRDQTVIVATDGSSLTVSTGNPSIKAAK
ncbi:MAG: MBL fold metallo-hydrolase [Ruminococcus sp.]|nr:MBL fold metallo-hydrolase [Ruminococcus sp.]MBQ1308510.1 MBL fold metallo-hydrolase [Ruminococcus sp.]MBQ1381452.1 MBL fold metallo-hydrolase [Ruminococcus sp.]MBQ1601360.1 MBL fold metallo-hydrolase [Ruminococcus sp.]MBQ2570569.1 MBL fold metallo-hydrolase [Ruminococcus sp.]